MGKAKLLPLFLAALLACSCTSDRANHSVSSPEAESSSALASQAEESLPAAGQPEQGGSNFSPEELEQLYREILLTYGAAEPEDPPKPGWLLAKKGASLYYSDIPWDEEHPMEQTSYYVWRLCWMWNQEADVDWQTAYSHPQVDAGWFYPADEYESLVTQYFPVTAEYLRQSELYRADLGGYNLPGGGGIGMTPWIILDRAEGNEEADGSLAVQLHVTLAFDTNHLEQNTYWILSARVQPDGSFQYTGWQEDPSPTQQQKEEALVVLADAPTGMGQVYTNEAYGLSVTLPANWADHYTADEVTNYYSDGSQAPAIAFYYQGQSAAPLGYLHLVPVAYWEARDPASSSLGSEIGRDEEYVYAYSTWGGANPFGPGEDHDFYEAMHLAPEEESAVQLEFSE